MKKRVLSIFMIMAILVSSFFVNGVTNSVEAKNKSQSYHIKKGKIYNKKKKLVKKKIVTIKKKKYYANKKGKVVKNKIFKYKKAKYFAQKKGVLAKSKIVTYKGKKYYAQKNYKIAIDKAVTVKGKIYYADKKGVLKFLADKKELDANKKTDDTKSDDTKSDDKKTEDEKSEGETKMGNSDPVTGAPIEDYEPLFPNDDAIDYLTPQMFDAKGDGKTDDTQAFRKLFKAAYNQGFDSAPGAKNPGWRHCKAIFIPSGRYIISGTIIDPDLGLAQSPMFEVSGAGRESTTLKFSGNVLFDNDNVFGFTTFRDIEFSGSNKNTFMNFKNKSGSGNAQRLQFISCSFVNWNQIIKCVKSDQMLSEVTFAYCKISSCGSLDNPCILFTLDCTQAVNWRYDFCDIESFHGDAFYFKQGASVCVVGGSIIPSSGNVINFDLPTPELAGGAGPGNAYHVLCYSTRFEIKNFKEVPDEKKSCLLRTNTYSPNTASVKFDSCGLCTISNNSPNFMVINGAINADFNNCHGATNIRINGNTTKEGWYNPRLRFTDCDDLNIKYMIENSTIINNKSESFVKNYVRVSVDDSYDFYIGEKKYIQTISGLDLCRQNLKLNEWKTFGLSNNRTIYLDKENENGTYFNPYGFVESIEVTVLKNDEYGDKYPVNMTVYKGDKKISEVTLKFGANNTYSLPVKEFGEDLKVVFTHSNSKNPSIDMNMALIKY